MKYCLANISFVLNARFLHVSWTCMIAFSSLGMKLRIRTITSDGRSGSDGAMVGLFLSIYSVSKTPLR